jgi:hypothetical protein
MGPVGAGSIPACFSKSRSMTAYFCRKAFTLNETKLSNYLIFFNRLQTNSKLESQKLVAYDYKE